MSGTDAQGPGADLHLDLAAACIPDPPGDEVLPPAVLHLRRTVAALARRALGRALS